METPRQIQRYGFAVATVAIALGLTVLLNPWAALIQAPFLLFFGAVILSAWYGGLGTGVTATVLSALSVYFFLNHHDAWAENPNSLRLLLFIGEGLLISGLWDAFRQAKQQAANNLQTVEANQHSLRRAIAQISQLQESEAYFRQLAENAKEIFWVLDLQQRRIVYMSPAYETIFGRSRQSLEQQPRSWLELIHPDDRDRVTQAIDRIYDSENFDQEYRILKADGSVRWIWGRTFPVQQDEQGQVCRIAGIAEDITERKQAEEDLRQSEERLRVALKNSPVTVFTQDQELRYTWIYNNPRYGLSDQELLGLRDADLLPPAQAELLTRLKHQVMTTGIGIREEIQLPMGNQDSWFDLTIEPLRNTQQAVIGVTCAAIDLSSRRQMEEALRTNQTLLNALLASSPIGMAFLDRDLRYVHANEALAQINDLPLSEHLGRTLWEALPQWADYIAPIVQQVMETQEPLLNQEMNGPSKAGVYRHCLVSYYPVCLPDNQVLGVGVTCMDITEIKHTEQALRESETRFRQMADGAPVFIWMLGTDGYFTYFNQLWLEFVGQSLETALAGSWSDGVHPDDYQACVHTYEIAFEARDRLDIVYRHRRADGEYRWLLSTGIPLFDTHGTFTGYIGSGIDITDRRRAEMALQESEERLSLAMEASQMGLWDWNFQTNQLSWSYHHARLFGIDPTVLSGTYELLLERIHPDDRELVKQAILESFTRETDEVEFRVIWPDGSLHWIIGKGQIFYNDQGQPVRMIGVAQENTERKLAQQERDRLLAQEQLARQEAEAANRVKDEFLAVLSHELRSPLNPILGWAKILRSRQLDPATTDRALETIERNARHQTQLIEDLLDVSRILRGKLALTVYPVNLATVIEAALETVQLAVEAKSIEVQRQICPSLADDMPSQFYVSGDSSRLQQIVWNLLSNAVKFTPEGGKVTIVLKQVDSHVEIQVQDTGHGISDEFLPHVFEYFRQEDGTTTRQYGGLGLGLAIVRHLTELHGGTVRAESPGEGQGATFTVRLPLLKHKPLSRSHSNDSNDSEFNLPSPSTSTLNPMLSGVHILVVDDEPDMLNLATTLLERQGAIVNVAASASEALTLLEQTQADVLVGDIGMPTVDGYALIHQIRQRSPEQGGQIPAIALTAYASESDQQRAIAAGYQLHLSKPVEPEQLIQAIVQLTHGPV